MVVKFEDELRVQTWQSFTQQCWLLRSGSGRCMTYATRPSKSRCNRLLRLCPDWDAPNLTMYGRLLQRLWRNALTGCVNAAWQGTAGNHAERGVVPLDR